MKGRTSAEREEAPVAQDGGGASSAADRAPAVPQRLDVIAATLTVGRMLPVGARLRQLWYVAGVPLMLLAAARVAWGEGWPAMVGDAALMTTLLCVAYVGAWLVSFRLERFPSVNLVGSGLVNLTGAFLVALAALALSHSYYATDFVLVAYGCSVLWFTLGAFVQSRTRVLRFAVIPGGIVSRLLTLRNIRRIEPGGDLRRAVDGIVADLHAAHDPAFVRFMANNSLRGVPVYHAAFVHELLTGRTLLDAITEEVIEELPRRSLYLPLRRALEVAVVLTTLPLVFPLMLVLALAVRMDSPGPVLFRQRRVGFGGRPFDMLKFRSMYVDAERHGARFADQGDVRVTRVGRVLRQWRLDELPQFWNVLRGDMSLIGPRPEQCAMAEGFAAGIPFYPYRHLVRPGITGWAQVHSGYAATEDETRRKLEYDLYYVKHQSFSLDLLIVYKTMRTIVTGFGSR